MHLNMVRVPPAGRAGKFSEASSWAWNDKFMYSKNYNYHFENGYLYVNFEQYEKTKNIQYSAIY